jgi:hypothetical protein
MRRAVGLVAFLAIALAGCQAVDLSGSPGTSPPTNLGMSNGTTLAVSLVVNGRAVALFPPGGPVPTIEVAALPPLPWKVEAKSPSGRVLTSMRVEPGEVGVSSAPGMVGRNGVFGRVDLSCGRLTIWAGDVQPSGPMPPPSPGTPGDCDP